MSSGSLELFGSAIGPKRSWASSQRCSSSSASPALSAATFACRLSGWRSTIRPKHSAARACSFAAAAASPHASSSSSFIRASSGFPRISSASICTVLVGVAAL